MKIFNSKFATLAVAATLTLGAGVAGAQVGCNWWNGPAGQGQYYMGPGMMYGYGPMMGQLNWQDRQALLQGKLNLTDNQKQAWKDYSDAVGAAHKKQPKVKPQQPADQQARLEARIANLKARLAVAENLLKARQNLLSVLNEDQVKILKDYEALMHQPKVRPAKRAPRAMAPQNSQAGQGMIYAVPSENGVTYYYVPGNAQQQQPQAPAAQPQAPQAQSSQPAPVAPAVQPAAPSANATVEQQAPTAPTAASTEGQPATPIAAVASSDSQAAAPVVAPVQASAEASDATQQDLPPYQVVAVPSENGVTYYMVPTSQTQE